MRIIESPYLLKVETVETERSQKRRRKKPWAKKQVISRSYPDPNFYQTTEGIICHPSVANQLRREIKAAMEATS